MRYLIVCTFVFVTLVASSAGAQVPGRVEIGATVISTTLDEFDDTDTGIGARVSWLLLPLIGIEGEFNFFPEDFPTDRNAFSSARTEGLVGITVGPQLGPIRVFGKLRPGFMRFAEAPGPLACIAIFPPPLSCTLAAGHTLTAIDIGGGASVSLPGRAFLRVDLSSLLIKYPGPVISRREVHQESFYGRNLRLGVGGGWRF